MHLKIWFILPFMIIACHSPVKTAETTTAEDRIHEEIEQYIKRGIKDTTTYRPVKFGSLIKDYSNADSTEEMHKIDDSIRNLEKLKSNAGAQFFKNKISHVEYKTEKTGYKEKLTQLYIRELNLRKKYKTEFIGYKIFHNYQLKGTSGEWNPESVWVKLDTAYHIKKIQ